jgi:hypothetical protein
MMGDSEQGGFKVHDRRIFDAEGEERTARPEEKMAEPETSDAGTVIGESSAAGGPQAAAEAGIDFSGFVVSLATTGMMHLGAIPDPVTGKRDVNLPGARQMVEILTVLREKTQGNLSPEETQLLDSLIYELQMGILTQSKSINL